MLLYLGFAHQKAKFRVTDFTITYKLAVSDAWNIYTYVGFESLKWP